MKRFDSDNELRSLQTWLDKEMDRDTEQQLDDIIWTLSADLEGDPLFQREIARCRRLVARKQQWRSLWQSVTGITGKMATAALVVGLAVGIAYLQMSQSDPVYHTDIGEQQFVTLADGSTITLNTNTELRVEFDDFTRRIRMVRGEAIFKVAHNPVRPFEVYAGQGVTRALGTAFNVFIDHDRISVAVLEGNVEVNTKSRPNKAPVQLAVGKAVNYFSQGSITPVYDANLRKIRGWEEKKLVFEDTRLQDIVAEYNRYSKKRLVLGSADLEDLSVSGVFRIGNLDSLLFTLQEIFSITPVDQGDRIILIQQPLVKPAALQALS